MVDEESRLLRIVCASMSRVPFKLLVGYVTLRINEGVCIGIELELGKYIHLCEICFAGIRMCVLCFVATDLLQYYRTQDHSWNVCWQKSRMVQTLWQP